MSRLYNEKPSFPFWLGGIWEGPVEDGFLIDALHRVKLEFVGDSAPPQSGAGWIKAWVVGQNQDVLSVTRWQSLGPRQSSPPHSLASQARAFSRFVHEVRTYWWGRGLCEVQTPYLVSCPGLEPTLEPFVTESAQGRERRTVYLPTSPEIHLKKALGLGLTDIFEIKTCFRLGEFSSHHQPEFTMLEWYRALGDNDLLIADLTDFVQAMAKAVGAPQPVTIEVTDFATLFRKFLNFTLTPLTTRQELLELCRKGGLHTHESDTFTDLFHRLMIECIEPAMARLGPLVVRRFPPAMAALARLDSEGWADRFEFYWNGLEIANAFYEVVNPEEQRQRWEFEQSERKRLGTTPLPTDEEMVEALRHGLAPTSGIAVGLERLFMAMTGVKDIRELKLFS